MWYGVLRSIAFPELLLFASYPLMFLNHRLPVESSGKYYSFSLVISQKACTWAISCAIKVFLDVLSWINFIITKLIKTKQNVTHMIGKSEWLGGVLVYRFTNTWY